MVSKRGQNPAVNWQSPNGLNSKQYVCGYCSSFVGSNIGYYSLDSRSGYAEAFIYICSFCKYPTVFDAKTNEQIPGPLFGDRIDFLPAEVESIYAEARASHAAGAFTGSVMLCRKILMHIAVSKGAKEGESFVTYVDYLDAKNYLPPDGKTWVDEIRKVGNETNHDIKINSKTESEELISFVEMLLKFIFEFPGKIKSKTAKANGSTS